MERKPERSHGMTHRKVWCENVVGMGPAGAKALRQLPVWCSRKSQRSVELEWGENRGGMKQIRAGLNSHQILWVW